MTNQIGKRNNNGKIIQKGRNILKSCSKYQLSTSFTKILSDDPYVDLYTKDGYKQLKELEMFQKLISDISSIQEHELFSQSNNKIFDSTEYFNLQFGQFHHESINLDAI
eukprot:47776_1